MAAPDRCPECGWNFPLGLGRIHRCVPECSRSRGESEKGSERVKVSDAGTVFGIKQGDCIGDARLVIGSAAVDAAPFDKFVGGYDDLG